jgi:hypothetical protein
MPWARPLTLRVRLSVCTQLGPALLSWGFGCGHLHTWARPALLLVTQGQGPCFLWAWGFPTAQAYILALEDSGSGSHELTGFPWQRKLQFLCSEAWRECQSLGLRPVLGPVLPVPRDLGQSPGAL